MVFKFFYHYIIPLIVYQLFNFVYYTAHTIKYSENELNYHLITVFSGNSCNEDLYFLLFEHLLGYKRSCLNHNLLVFKIPKKGYIQIGSKLKRALQF